MEPAGSKIVEINEIVVPGWADRTICSENEVEELAKSIEASGLIEPIIVRELGDGRCELISDSMRLKALKRLGRRTVEAKIIRCSSEEALALSIEENLKRYSEHPFDTARKIAYMHKSLGMSIREISRRLNRDPTWVAMMLKIDSISEEAKKILAPEVKDYHILYEISGLNKPEEQEFASKFIVKYGLGRREAIDLVRDIKTRGLEAIRSEHAELLIESESGRREDLNISKVFTMVNTSEAYKDSYKLKTPEAPRPPEHEELRECSICGERIPRNSVRYRVYCKGKHDSMDELFSWLHSFKAEDRDYALSSLHEILIWTRGLDIHMLGEVVEEVKKRHA